MTWTKIGTVALLAALAMPSVARGECRLRNGPITIFRSGTLDKVYALGQERYAEAVSLYAACASVPDGTKLERVDRGFLSSTVVVKEGKHSGCTGDLENEFIRCE